MRITAVAGEKQADEEDLLFRDRFTIGRDEDCELQIDSGLVSRRHVDIVIENGAWWICDRGSANGTYIDGKRIDRERIEQDTEIHLAQNGPIVLLSPVAVEEAAAPNDRFSAARSWNASADRIASAPRAEKPAEEPPTDIDHYIAHYFEEGDGPAGERTIFIRKAFQQVQKKQMKRYTWLFALAGVIILLVSTVAIWQSIKANRQERLAEQFFYSMQEQEVIAAQLRRVIEEEGRTDLRVQLEQIEARQRERAADYEGFVQELGRYRRLTEEERLIYRVARTFNESDVVIPASFVRAVRDTIHSYWLQGGGRARFIRAIRTAEENGYTQHIAETMQRYGLPPQFFYLALQESDFNIRATGPETRWGIAKGMWQFIPDTGKRFELYIGPLERQRVFDPDDDRHNFHRSSEAAARYLLEIYSTLAQASGLLVMASYNWGEHRVAPRLDRLPQPHEVMEQMYEGVPEDPRSRNYWRFLNEYSDRMPEETKDYVLKIFSAAVIGENPRMFGFDFDNPLEPYLR